MHRVAITAFMSSIVQVFQELRMRAPDLPPRRMLDFGAGPGTATWAAAEVRTLQPAVPIGPLRTMVAWLCSMCEDPD